MSAGGAPRVAVVLIGHGTVDDLDDLPPFLAAIRRGHPAPPALVAEVRRRYEAIGGQSPLTRISEEVARALEARVNVPVRVAMRLWKPYPRDVLSRLASEGVTDVVVVPLAQHSAPIYGEAVAAAARELGGGLRVTCAPNWGLEPALTRAFADAIRRALDDEGHARATTRLLLTAHSLPIAVIRGGDPYEALVRESAAAVVRDLGPAVEDAAVAFQSQGMGGGEWLGPDLPSALDAARAGGKARVLVAPIGFLADHVEILYDLDVEAKALAAERGLTLTRTRSLNASSGFIDALEAVARPLLAAVGRP